MARIRLNRITSLILVALLFIGCIPLPVSAGTVEEDWLPILAVWQAGVTDGNTTRYDGYNSTDGTTWQAWIYRTGDGSTTWTPRGVDEVDVLVVAGGGGGGSSYDGGGGGAGGLVYSEGLSITGASLAITIGQGGSGGSPAISMTTGDNGDDSIFGDPTDGGIKALGGGGGGGVTASDGGSGGGQRGLNCAEGFGASATQPDSTWGGFGYDGGDVFTTSRYSAGGGGGAGGAGENAGTSFGIAGDGGLGKQIWGTMYAGGGGGSAYLASTPTPGDGGSGIGGDGGAASVETSPRRQPTSGAVNTGSGGGGASREDYGGGDIGGDGSNGIIIIRYASETGVTADFTANSTVIDRGTDLILTRSMTGDVYQYTFSRQENGTSGYTTFTTVTNSTPDPIANTGVTTHDISGWDPGTYDIRMYVQGINALTNDTLIRYSYLDIGDKPVSVFSADKTVTDLAETIQFTDSSTNTPTSWEWDYQINGTPGWVGFNTTQNPGYTFTATGTYDIRLNASNAYGYSIETKPEYIEIGNKPVSAFSADKTVTDLAETIQFTDSSTNTPTSWQWDYQINGTPGWVGFNTTQNPGYTFSATGTYDIRLNASNAYGYSIETKPEYIEIGNKPISSYDYSQTPATLDVSFTDTSTNTPTSWSWNFGDGNASSAQNPTHTYAWEGAFNTSLNVTNAYGSSISYTLIDVYLKPTAAFGANKTVTHPGDPILFTDSSAGNPDSWYWEFGDVTTSTSQHPVKTYATPGTYSVNLTVTNTGGTDYELKTNYITIGNKPVAGFSLAQTPGTLSFSFTDTSTNTPTSWSWNFGDGNTSSVQNPSHTYVAEGAYTVTLTATNAYGADSTSDTANAFNVPTAGFTASPVTGIAGTTTIRVTDSSTNAITWLYNFGDGTTSTSQNPSHIYAAAGTYTITQTVYNTGGNDTLTRTDYIKIGTLPTAIIIADPTTTTNFPATVSFNGSTSLPGTGPDATISSYAWQFGDSSTGTGANTAYIYPTTGRFTATLTVTNPYGSHSTTELIDIGGIGYRPKVGAADKIAYEDTSSFAALMGLVGEDRMETTVGESNIDLEGMPDIIIASLIASMGPYTMLIIISIPIIGIAIMQGKTLIPGTIGILLMFWARSYLPADTHNVIYLMIGLYLVAVLWGIYKERF